MRGKIGFWRTGLYVALDREAVDLFKQQQRGPILEVSPLRHVLLRFPERPFTGAKVYAVNEGTPSAIKAHGHGVHGYCEASGSHLLWPWPNFELPRFEVMPLSFEYSYAHDAFLSDEPLPDDHKLPWPKRRLAESRMTHQELLHQCYLRVRSAIRAGTAGHFEDAGVPKDVLLDHLRGGHWGNLQERARSELAVSDGGGR